MTSFNLSSNFDLLWEVMRLDRLTNKFQLALADAQSLALGHDNQFIEPLHLMSALLNQEGDRYVLY